jgi:ATP-dependent Clp protease adaptor protein ClpS
MTTCPDRNEKKTGIFDPKRTLAGPFGMRSERDDKGDKGDDDAFDTGLATKAKTKVKRPSLYRVLLLNDDYTPMEFVVAILQQVFNRSQDDAIRIMMLVHNTASGNAGSTPTKWPKPR